MLEAQDLRSLLKELLREMFTQEREMLSELIYEVMEDVAITLEIAEGKDSENVERNEILNL